MMKFETFFSLETGEEGRLGHMTFKGGNSTEIDTKRGPWSIFWIGGAIAVPT